MALSKYPANRAKQLANLRPAKPGQCAAVAAGKDLSNVPPEKMCKATAWTTGKQCRQIAMNGATKCRKHGGRRQLGLPPTEWTLATREAFRVLSAMAQANRIPRDLEQTAAWQLASAEKVGRGVQMKARLALAWEALQAGDPGPWRDANRDAGTL